MMSSPSDPSEDGDWSAALTALQQFHGQLSTTAEALRGVLARPAAREDGEVMGLEWAATRRSEAERAALYASVCADLQLLGALTESLAQLSDLLKARGPTIPHR
jgi:hypothetical protein